MIDYLKHMAIFASVIDNGSFRGAAKSLHLAPSRISQMVSDLEEHLGVTLLYRTTRKLALTQEGRQFYPKVVDMLKSAEAGINELNALTDAPAGSLTISMPAFMACSDITSVIAEFTQRYPRVSLSISFDDHPVGLLDSGCDLNIRIGWLADSAMLARKLGEYDRIIVTSADYAKTRPAPQHPDDLKSWNWISFKQRGNTFTLVKQEQECHVQFDHYQLEVDNVDALTHLVHQGVGVTVLPHYIVSESIANGQLVQLLPDWTLPKLGCYAVWADQSRRENLTLMLVRFLADALQNKPIGNHRPMG